MPNDIPKTTLYIQAILTTDSMPDFSFFRQLSNAKAHVASENMPALLENVVEENKPKNKFKEERKGNPNRPISSGQIRFVKSLADEGRFNLMDILQAYHVADLSELTDADAQDNFKKYK